MKKPKAKSPASLSDLLKGFKLDGRQFQVMAIPAAVERLREKLDALPDGQLVQSDGAAGFAGVCRQGLKAHARHPVLAPYRHLITVSLGRVLVWGNRPTIQKLKEKLSACR